MNKFLNTSSHVPSESGPDSLSPTLPRSPQPTPQPPASLGRSVSSHRVIPHHRNHSSMSRPASVDLGYITKTSSIADSESDISASIIAQFEQEMVHNNFKRDSFRARYASTREFVLNPIFDEAASSSVVPQESFTPSSISVRRKQSISDMSQEKVNTKLSTPVVETVFTDLGTLRRSGSTKSSSIKEYYKHSIRRNNSFRSNTS